MGSRVYADITFLVNFLMDFIILWVTVRLTGVPVSYMRIAVAAGVGGIYAVGYLFPELSLVYSLPLKVLLSVFLVIMAVLPRTWRDLLKSIGFYGINFLVAGASIGFSYLVQSSYQVNFSYWWLLAGISLRCYWVYTVKTGFPNVSTSVVKVPVQLTFDRNRCLGQGFVDTGNGLRDPLLTSGYHC